MLGKLDSHMQKKQTGLLSHTKINSKWIKNLNVRPETIKLLEDNIGSTFDIGLRNIFLGMSPQARAKKGKTNRWDNIKLKSFCTAEETINKTKRPPNEWEKIFANDISDEFHMQIYTKNSYNSTSRKQTT